MGYKYALSVTSQAAFCSTPIRLDSYNACQFGCAFCFAKSRGGNIFPSKLEVADAESLQRRFLRIRSGKLQSALDELLSSRVPIQLGGMTDPFSPWETKLRATLGLLQVLSREDYPTIISTKSVLVAEKPYLELIRDGNFYVRFSLTGASQDLATELEAGVPAAYERLNAMAELSKAGIPVSARVQPIIYGHEESTKQILLEAANSGARHVAVEHLKVPVERSLTQSKALERVLPHIKDRYLDLGARRVGREYVLPPARKLDGHEYLSSAARKLGIRYGYADNEFLLRNAFQSCCNGADLFLRDASIFKANILGLLKEGTQPERKFTRLQTKTLPSFPIDNYLNSRSRASVEEEMSPGERWRSLLRQKWNAKSWRGGPLSFWRVAETGRTDELGDKIFEIQDPTALSALRDGITA